MSSTAWLALAGSLVSLFLLSLLHLSLVKSYQEQIKRQTEMNQTLTKNNQDLLNRLMSRDVQTYSVMTASTHSSQTSTFNDQYYPQSDAAELARLQAMAAEYGNSMGLGDSVFDDDQEAAEAAAMLQDMGAQVRLETRD